MRRGARCLLAASLFACAATGAIAQVRDYKPVTQDMLLKPDPADWLMISRTYDEQRFSPLDQINKANVGQLRMAFARGLPPGTLESTPLVHDGVMYMIEPGASLLAVDATNGDLVWDHALFGYTIGHPDNDLSFDERDSAPFMPKSVVVDRASTGMASPRATRSTAAPSSA